MCAQFALLGTILFGFRAPMCRWYFPTFLDSMLEKQNANHVQRSGGSKNPFALCGGKNS